VEREQQDGSWVAGTTWFGPNVTGDESDPTTWIYRAGLTLFWPAPWDTSGSAAGPVTQAGSYRIHVTLDGQTLPVYALTIVP
jgi:hypothetical protein